MENFVIIVQKGGIKCIQDYEIYVKIMTYHKQSVQKSGTFQRTVT